MAVGTRDPSMQLPADMLETIDAIASVAERSRGWVIERALRQYLDTEGGAALAIAASRQSAASEPLEDFDDVIADIEKITAREPVKAA
jgi:predicted transcriptional regulator